MNQKIRGSDVLARLGGDEFAVLLKHCPPERAVQVAQVLLESVQSYRFVWGERIFKVGVSIGVVPIKTEGQAQALLSLADMACYAAKDRGRNRIHLYSEEDQDILLRRGDMNWLQRIQTAIANDHFFLCRQRIQALQGNAHHFELLLRMQGDGRQIITPDLFIPAAERYNLMPEIDRWVIGQACRQLQLLRQSSSGADSGTCFINLSANSLSDDNLIEYIRQQLNSHAIAPPSIGFEITETAAVADFECACKLLEAIRALGCRVALDDFGTGMSSFSYLRSLPVDYIKIDGQFVKAMLGNEIDRAIVEAVNNISHIAGIQTIAEYVENEAILQRLLAMNVDYAQGWAIERPKPFTSPGRGG